MIVIQLSNPFLGQCLGSQLYVRMLSLLRSLAFLPAGKFYKSFSRMEWSRASLSSTGILKMGKKKYIFVYLCF